MKSMEKIAVLHRQMQKCAMQRGITQGKCCHVASIKSQLQEDLLTSNILINMYSKLGLIVSARQIFDRMPIKSIVSWNSMIAGLVNLQKDEEVLSLFSILHREGIPASEHTLSTILSLHSLSRIRASQLHSLALKISMSENLHVGTALLNIYFKSGAPQSARRIFDEMREKSSVTWSSMIAGLVHNQLYEESFKMFQTAQREKTEYTEFTFSAILTACASSAASSITLQLHPLLVKTGLDLNLFVITSLVDAYSRIGRIKEAYEVFCEARTIGSVAVWNAMIGGFSRHGRALEALILVEKMRQSGVPLDEVTYSSAISASGRSGSVEEAARLFSEIVCPNSVHYSCMLDAFLRAGKFEEARDLIVRMPFEPTVAMIGSLLGSCKIYGNLDLGKRVAACLFRIEPGNGGNHVVLASMLADRRCWEEVAEARRMMEERGLRKEQGVSWIGFGGR